MPARIPQCAACTRRIADAADRGWRRPNPGFLFQQQVRGKKTSKQPDTIIVRLRKDVQAFGKKGALVPVSIGQMRNIWYPRRTAEYVPAIQLHDMVKKNIPMERDYQFGVVVKEDSAEVRQLEAGEDTAVPAPKVKEVKLLSTERALQLIDIFVPHRIDFYRRPVEAEPEQPALPAQPPPPSRTRRGSRSAADELFDAESPAIENPALPVVQNTKKELEKIAIYGSVSTTEIANNIKALLAENDEAALVVLTAEDVQFMTENEEDDKHRAKFLGEYEVEIRVKGSEEAVNRMVRVLPTVE